MAGGAGIATTKNTREIQGTHAAVGAWVAYTEVVMERGAAFEA